MRTFSYDWTDPMGIHVQPASRIFMEARKYSCSIEVFCGEEKADCKEIMELMGLGAGQGKTLCFQFDGMDEEEAEQGLRSVLSQM